MIICARAWGKNYGRTHTFSVYNNAEPLQYVGVRSNNNNGKRSKKSQNYLSQQSNLLTVIAKKYNRLFFRGIEADTIWTPRFYIYEKYYYAY